MIDRPFESIEAVDLQRLVENAVPEGRTLEYKEQLPGGADDVRREFLADVSSLANATGGDVIYGVREEREGGRATGLPASIDGLAVSNLDAEIQRLENMLRDGVAPRIPGIRYRRVLGFPNGPALVVRVPRSWNGPHMVTFQKHSRFYSRNAGGKHAMDVEELRGAFLNAGSVAERVRGFRIERIGRLVAGQAPVELSTTKLVAVHLVPISSLAGGAEVDLLKAVHLQEVMRPLNSRSWSSRFNVDGLLTYEPSAKSSSASYVQLFRSGILEAVSACLMCSFGDVPEGLSSTLFARELFGFFDRGRRLVRELELQPPVAVQVSLVGVKGLLLRVPDRMYGLGRQAFDRDTILLPGLLLQEIADEAHALLRPVLDLLWQAAGFERCFDYDDSGNWSTRG